MVPVRTVHTSQVMLLVHIMAGEYLDWSCALPVMSEVAMSGCLPVSVFMSLQQILGSGIVGHMANVHLTFFFLNHWIVFQSWLYHPTTITQSLIGIFISGFTMNQIVGTAVWEI